MGLRTAEPHARPRLARERGEASLAIRRQLVTQLVRLIRDRGLNQVQTANWLSVDQSRVSDLLNDKLSRFSTDTLVDMIARAGMNVTMSFDTHEGSITRDAGSGRMSHLNA